jgi:hypothetical protein
MALVLAFEPSRAEEFSCGEAYQRSLGVIELRKPSPEQRAALRRHALRAYQACMTGDVYDPKSLFDRLERSPN